MNPSLIARRRAAHVLNELVKNLKFGSKGEYWDPEDHNRWIVYGDNIVHAKRSKTLVATVEMMEGTLCHLTLPRWDGLIRTEHLADFDPAHYGLVENTAEDVLFREKYPDSIGTVDFGEPMGLGLPAHPMMQRVRHRAPRVIM